MPSSVKQLRLRRPLGAGKVLCCNDFPSGCRGIVTLPPQHRHLGAHATAESWIDGGEIAGPRAVDRQHEVGGAIRRG